MLLLLYKRGNFLLHGMETETCLVYDGMEKEEVMLTENKIEPATYIYTYACAEEELSLCALERRCMFGIGTNSNVIQSSIKIATGRSPFIKERMEVWCKGETFEQLCEKVKGLPKLDVTFKIKVINHNSEPKLDKIGFKERREIERRIGLLIPGKADLHQPEILLAVIKINGEWFFGPYMESESIWFLHQQKPHQYSTALSTRVARAVVNIAVPHPAQQKVIDPCCGIGTVLVEALSMGVDIIGSDNNPLIMKGARENIAHFGFKGEVLLRDIREVKGSFDAAIIDMPYNLCSVISTEAKLEMLQSARGFTKKLVMVTIEPMDSIIKKAGFAIIDRCEVLKGRFKRDILVCE